MDDKRDAIMAANDPLLHEVVRAEDEGSRRDALAAVVAEHARPLLAAIFGRFRRSEPLLPQDVEELEATVLLRMVRRLQTISEAPEQAIAQFQNYVAKLAYNTLYDLRRTRFPERTRLKNRIRYLLTHDPRLALWTTETATLAGLAADRGTDAFAKSFDVATIDVTPVMKDPSRPADALAALLAARGRPVPFDMLVRVVADLWHVRDTADHITNVMPEDRDQLTTLQEQEYMVVLWQEISMLPPNQRVALLLNLRDGSGSNALTLFLLLSIVTLEEIALAVGFTTAELLDVWDQLPLEDNIIAARLGLTRQQVINLRKSARARLSRRTVHIR